MNDQILADARMRTLCRLSAPTIHELRGAANALALHVQLLGVDPGDGDGRERRERSLVAADEGRRRLFDIAETFVRHATLPDSQPGTFDLARITHDAVALSRPYAVQRRVAMTIAATAAAAPVHGRRDVVWQVLVDALLGLCDGSPHGAAVEVATAARGEDATVRAHGSQAALDPELVERWASVMQWAGGSLRVDDGTIVIGLPATRLTQREGTHEG